METARRAVKVLGLRRAARWVRALVAEDEPVWKSRGRRDEQHLKAILTSVLTPDANCIDVGASAGDVLADIVRAAPNGRHIAFEPLPEFAETLARRFPTVDVRCVALSNTVGTRPFVHVKNLPAYSGLRERDYPDGVDLEHITVRTERLDDAIPPEYIPDLIKIDVEGAEYLVMDGARMTIARYRPIVVFESSGVDNPYGTRLKDVHQLLCMEAGLRIFDLDGNGPYSYEEFSQTMFFNFIAHR